MSKKVNDSQYNSSDTIGYGQQQFVYATVVNIKDDKEKAGRCQIRIEGEQNNEQDIPDKNLIWARPMHSTHSAALKGTGASTGLLPGTKVLIMKTGGPSAQEYIIMGSMGKGDKDDKTDTNPAVHGKGNTHKSKKNTKQDQNASWNKRPEEITTTKEARQLEDDPFHSRRENSKIEQSRSSPAGGSGENRTAGKDHEGGTISSTKFSGKSAQEFIQNTIQNKSAIVSQFLPMLQQLKQVKGNPTAIESVGAGNLLGAMEQIMKLFPKKKRKENEEPTEEEIQEEELLNLLRNMV